MGEHQTHFVTYCFLLNTWLLLKKNRLISVEVIMVLIILISGGWPQEPHILHWCKGDKPSCGESLIAANTNVREREHSDLPLQNNNSLLKL